MPLIATVSDRMIALDHGRTIAEGPPDEVLDHPEVVASYLGTTASVIQRSGTARGHADRHVMTHRSESDATSE